MAVIPVKLNPTLDFARDNLCEGCGNCCIRTPIFGEWEAKAIEKKTGMRLDEFAIVTKPADSTYGAFFATKRGADGLHCIFLDDDRRCSIYEVAPDNCRESSCYPRNQIVPTLIASGIINLEEAKAMKSRIGPHRFVNICEIVYRNALMMKPLEQDKKLGDNAFSVLQSNEALSNESVEYYKRILLAPYKF